MQTKNFTIASDFIGLLYQDKYFDLHNDFDLVHTKFDSKEKIAELNFIKNIGNWVPKDSPNALTLLFENVIAIYNKDHDSDHPIEYIEQDQFTISMIGFSNDDHEMGGTIDNQLIRQDFPALLVVMETGKAIKIIADTVELLVITN